MTGWEGDRIGGRRVGRRVNSKKTPPGSRREIISGKNNRRKEAQIGGGWVVRREGRGDEDLRENV